MRRSSLVLAGALAVLLAPLACDCDLKGGGAGWGVGTPPGADSGNADDASADEGTEASLDDGSDATQSPGMCPPESEVQSNAPCSVPPAMPCKSATHTVDCTGQVDGFVSCTCIGGAWACAPATTCADANPCPAPTDVYGNAACSLPPNTECKSAANTVDCSGQVDGFVSCSCASGSWLCGPSSTCVDGGADGGGDSTCVDGGGDAACADGGGD